MKTKFVRDVMKIGVPTCEMDTKLNEVAQIMMRDQADVVVVMDEVGAAGIISQSDLVRAFPRNYELLSAKDVMTTNRVVSIPPDSALTAVAQIMQDEKVHQVFVMHEHPGAGKPSAVVTMKAIVREMAGLEPEKPEALKKLEKAAAAKKAAKK